MSDATLSQYDQDFADAMALKLKLNREQRSKDTEVSAKVPAPSVPSAGLSNISEAIVLRSMERFPGLTRQEAMQMLREAGG
ncbi:MAG: hypothetical protein P8M25_02905 [Paracoccaceae bacterium]|jgi:hypothetical protein|nr:hypothetical protein [Paracoccaceae bacterium]